jgi:hypothetical protein
MTIKTGQSGTDIKMLNTCGSDCRIEGIDLVNLMKAHKSVIGLRLRIRSLKDTINAVNRYG